MKNLPETLFLALAVGSTLTACASLGKPSGAAARTAPASGERALAILPVDDPQRLPAITAAAGPFERDRAAILAMLGEYAVRFDFTETVALKAGYAKHASKTTDAHETVVLVEDTGKRIVLQHLLVSDHGGQVIKHWRQDWQFEAPDRLDFTEDQVWRVRPVAVEAGTGTWTQCVYEVSDAPRYCGTARWTYHQGIAQWESDPVWRPLPRREYTKRSDYNGLRGINRHTITPTGWTHEQFNTKAVRRGEKTTDVLVREFGFNDYRRDQGFDFKPAYVYWAKTGEFWAGIRQQWASRIAAQQGIALRTTVDGMKIIGPLLEQSEKVAKGEAIAPADSARVFDEFTAAPGNASVSSPVATGSGHAGY